MRTVDFAVTIAQSKNDMNCAKISIGCPSHITEFYLMERIENAINDYPNMCISIDTESDSRELIEEIRQNKIDFAILDSVPADCKEELVIKELKKTKNIFISNGSNNSEKGVIYRLKEILDNETQKSSSSLLQKAGMEGSATASNNTLSRKITTYEKKIKELESNFSRRQQALYSKYATLETMMNKLNTQMSSLSSMFS